MKFNHSSVNLAVELMAAHGIEDVVLCPGSRNAPLIITLLGDSRFSCKVVVDERCAGYFALGMALKTGKTAAVVCTSGTAAANLLPAMTEAYFQRVPLLALTADRPPSLANTLDGQMIKQDGLFNGHTVFECSLSGRKEGAEYARDVRIFNMACTAATEQRAPVHVNIPLSEPLYSKVQDQAAIAAPRRVQRYFRPGVSSEMLAYMVQVWEKPGRKLIVAGQLAPNPSLTLALGKVLLASPETMLFAERIANTDLPQSVRTFDLAASDLSQEQLELLKPDVVLFLGEAIISKKLKALLRASSLRESIRVGLDISTPDPFLCLTAEIRCPADELMQEFANKIEHRNKRATALPKQEQEFAEAWQSCGKKVRRPLEVDASCFSEQRAVDIILSRIPEKSDVHLGNSMPVRLAENSPVERSLNYFANRGTGGIDGCLSTAFGFSSRTKNTNIALLGDLSFLYDSNALWIEELPANLTVFVLNNKGGGIFRVIDGAKDAPWREKGLAASHNFNMQKLVTNFNLAYQQADNQNTLVSIIAERFNNSANQNHQIALVVEVFPEL